MNSTYENDRKLQRSLHSSVLCALFLQIYLRDLFIEDDSVRRSERFAAKRNNINFKLPNVTTTQYENSFAITVIRLWEQLPADIV
ncbi:Protein of unknown function [Cotesia congregata]|uniref:Uncharacterized protein n=1 Tax=Cotesia congregata TaxID=51543 RepID=A0A8J2HBW5_COTCN|nr:Protein of unknown function [Cotesia congregata]